jgi:hypothetical protein
MQKMHTNNYDLFLYCEDPYFRNRFLLYQNTTVGSSGQLESEIYLPTVLSAAASSALQTTRLAL